MIIAQTNTWIFKLLHINCKLHHNVPADFWKAELGGWTPYIFFGFQILICLSLVAQNVVLSGQILFFSDPIQLAGQPAGRQIRSNVQILCLEQCLQTTVVPYWADQLQKVFWHQRSAVTYWKDSARELLYRFFTVFHYNVLCCKTGNKA